MYTCVGGQHSVCLYWKRQFQSLTKHNSDSIMTLFTVQCVQELYRSLEKMRPNMFRMASNLKPEEEGMDEILQTNDDLLRVMDTYKRVVGVVPVVGEGGAGPTQNGGLAKGEGGGAGKMGNEVPEEAAAAGGGTGLGGGGGGGGDASTLIDLADLDFGAIPTTGVAPVTPSTADSLLDALGTLG